MKIQREKLQEFVKHEEKKKFLSKSTLKVEQRDKAQRRVFYAIDSDLRQTLELSETIKEHVRKRSGEFKGQTKERLNKLMPRSHSEKAMAVSLKALEMQPHR